MQEMGKIEIEHFIIHILDNKAPNLILSDEECEITPTVQRFLTEYIGYTWTSTGTKIARFRRSGNLVEDACNIMLEDPGVFVDQSREIADYLYKIMIRDRRISPGDLLICTFSAENMESPIVAIFKVDPAPAYFHEIRVEDGKTSVSIQEAPNALPHHSDLQKCVFVHFPDPEARKYFDLAILDTQISKLEERASEDNFFCKTFLNCALVLNDRDRTILFRKFTEKWLKSKKNKKEITDIEADTIGMLSIQTLKSPLINVPMFAQVAIPRAELQKDYLDYIHKKGLLDNQFTPDPITVDQYTKKRRFTGDGGLYVEVNADQFQNIITVGPQGPNGITQITIRTINWREVYL